MFQDFWNLKQTPEVVEKDFENYEAENGNFNYEIWYFCEDPFKPSSSVPDFHKKRLKEGFQGTRKCKMILREKSRGNTVRTRKFPTNRLFVSFLFHHLDYNVLTETIELLILLIIRDAAPLMRKKWNYPEILSGNWKLSTERILKAKFLVTFSLCIPSVCASYWSCIINERPEDYEEEKLVFMTFPRRPFIMLIRFVLK